MSKPQSKDEHIVELIARIGSGDDDAVAEFLDCYGDFIRRKIRREMRLGRLQRQRVVGESDIAQSVFFAFVQAARAGKIYAQYDYQAVQYILSCARNRVLLYVRRYSAACRDLNRVVDEPVESLACRIAAPDAEEPPVDSERLHAVLKQLRGGDAILLGHWLEGYPWDALAEFSETTPAAIRARLGRILHRVARTLERADPESFPAAAQHRRKAR